MENTSNTQKSSIARGGAIAPPLACQPKCRMGKHYVFSTFETVLCTEVD